MVAVVHIDGREIARANFEHGPEVASEFGILTE